MEPNISAWRRRTCGDFTGALGGRRPAAAYPRTPAALSLAAAQAGLLTAQQEVFANPAPVIPPANQQVTD
jgi:phospholipase C